MDREPTREELEAIYDDQVKDVLAARLASVITDMANMFSCADTINVLRALADEIESEIDSELQELLV